MDIPTVESADATVPFWKRRVHPRNAVLVVLAFVALFGYKFLSTPSGFLIETPGPAISLASKITSSPDSSFANSRIAYTTVQYVPLSEGDYLWRHFVRGQNNFVVAENVSSSQAAANAEMMTQAKLTAQYLAGYLALGKLGTVSAVGSQVIDVTNGSPAAAAQIQPGDVITQVNGHSASTPTALVALVNADARRGSLDLTVTRTGQPERHVRVDAKLHKDPKESTYRIGVRVGPYGRFTPPAGVPNINTEGVSGPSGGLMFTLALIDAMTPGSLTGSWSVAGTGTVDQTGTVGPIGGVKLKVRAAAAAGARVFFVDALDYHDAKAAAPSSLTVVKADTVLDPIEWLCANAPHDATHPKSQFCSQLAEVRTRMATLRG